MFPHFAEISSAKSFFSFFGEEANFFPTWNVGGIFSVENSSDFLQLRSIAASRPEMYLLKKCVAREEINFCRRENWKRIGESFSSETKRNLLVHQDELNVGD